jgi:hypothetical protein
MGFTQKLAFCRIRDDLTEPSFCLGEEIAASARLPALSTSPVGNIV